MSKDPCDFVECRRCDRREGIGTAQESDSWTEIVPSSVGSRPGDAWCASCVEAYFEEAKTLAVEKGRIPCYDPWRKHSDTHNVGGGKVDDCRPTHIPLTDEQYEEIRTAYQDRRHRVCPECRTSKDEIPTGEVRVKDLLLEGYTCECGWSGIEGEMSFVKR